MSEELEDAGVDWDILDDRVTMEILPREEGDVRVRFLDDDGTVLWSSVYERGFWNSRTKKGEIGNKLAQNTSFAKGTVKEELEAVWTDITENTDEYESELVSPSVNQLIQNTQEVEVYGGEDREIHVYVRAQPYGTYADGRQTDGGASVRRLVFENTEWVRSDGDTQTPPIVEKYSNAFYEVLDITWQEWREDIRPVWQDMQQIMSDDQLSTADRIAMSVVRSLRHRLDVHADRSKLINDTWNGWYEPDSTHGEVVWVDGDTLDDALDKHDKGTEYRSALSRALKSEGFTLGSRRQTTIQGDPVELYPFLPETLGVEDIDVIGLDDEDDDGDGEAASSDDDGGDGGDDGSAEANGMVGEVVDIIESLDPAGDGVPEAQVVAEASGERSIGPPAEVKDAIERGCLDGLLFRPTDGEDAVAVRPGGGRAPGEGDIDVSEDGVPEP